MTQVTDSIKRWTGNHRLFIFPFLAFVIPLVVRAIPEILMGPYVLGFDTMGFYIPNTLLWLHNGVNVWAYLATSPLIYLILVPLVAAGGSPVFLIKIISPLLLGFLALSVYLYAKKGLNWSPSKSAFVAILGTVYFVALRASWDQLREELGFVFLFIVLMLLIDRKERSWRGYTALSLAMVGVVLAHQLVSVIMFSIVIFTLAYELLHKDFGSLVNLILASLPAALYFVVNLAVVYSGTGAQSGFLNYSTNVGSALASWTGFTSYLSMLASEWGFFLYCYLLLLPFVLISIWRFGNLQLRSWLVVSLILLFIPFASVSPYRWVLMLTYPLAFYATDSISRLKLIKWKRFRITVHRIAILYLVLSTAILSFGFMFMSSAQPFFYFNPSQFNSYLNQVPSSMLQNTISITDCQSTVNVLQWFKENVNNSAILLTHTVFYGWALLTVNEDQVKTYGFGDPSTATMTAAQEGYTQIYLIWWINGQGWYGQPTLPSTFHEVYQNGKIAIYSYNSTL